MTNPLTQITVLVFFPVKGVIFFLLSTLQIPPLQSPQESDIWLSIFLSHIINQILSNVSIPPIFKHTQPQLSSNNPFRSSHLTPAPSTFLFPFFRAKFIASSLTFSLPFLIFFQLTSTSLESMPSQQRFSQRHTDFCIAKSTQLSSALDAVNPFLIKPLFLDIYDPTVLVFL